jgi:putative ABC transport system permease protein
VLASALGFAVGVGAAHGLQALLGAAGVDMPATELQVRPRTATISLAVGTALTVASAIVPALWAGRLPPIAAILGLSSAPARVRRRAASWPVRSRQSASADRGRAGQ